MRNEQLVPSSRRSLLCRCSETSYQAMKARGSAVAIGDIQTFDKLLNVGGDTAAWK